MGVINERRRMKPSYFFLFFKFPQILLYLLSTHFHLTFGLINLQFNKTKSSFKIAIFADLHFGENSWTDWGPQQDANSINAMNSLLHHENPDFVVYLGDVITANNIPIANASLYWDQATSPTRERGIPWAGVFGNHDDAHFVWPKEWFSKEGIPPLHCSQPNTSLIGDGNCSFMGTTRLELMNYQIGNDMLSFSQHGSRNLWPSVSNYVLQISSSENPESPVAFMYFLDSGGGSYPEVISSAQVEWLKGISEAINPDYRVPEIFFWHIPSKAYQKAAPWLFFVPQPCVGSINKEWVCTQESEEGIMKILKGRPSVQAVFVGHDHGNDWCCPYKKLWLCYARHTGYGGYGNWARGARILEIVDRPFTLKSWIRMEDGFVHSHILLSSHAAYPAPIFLLLVLLLVLFFGIKPFYRADLISKAKTFVSPIA
ncbi:probable inactive purple acid phosphatase 16 isoform X1 [Chenopodium quinoa]|uniref:probable inactive purple acid phosphatase 16 isoform X1 n=1 Tax=Chenopodium quinoa TaxID=63459 RepID=UPI000B783C76|nr:probable inactive purple acid phosphatase 16 isoform X1 [Chenopodium quinoa]